MTDVHDRETRSRNMAAIRSKNSKPEIVFRKSLFARGYRYRLHRKDLAGRPDLVLAKHRIAVFVHGCFWHLHDCHLFRWPKTNAKFWKRKISGNAQLDVEHQDVLIRSQWRVAVIWQCAIEGRRRKTMTAVLDEFEAWLEDDKARLEITGEDTHA